METIKIIIGDVLNAIYEPFGFAIIMTVLIMFFYIFAKEQGWKPLVKRWLESFKADAAFRCVFLFVFYTVLLLFRTLLNRRLGHNPLADVIGVWGLYDSQGKFSTDAVENLFLFIPFTMLMLWCFKVKILNNGVKLPTVLWKSCAITFLFSILIEFLQLLLRVGMFQVSDIFHNTLGGFIGGFLYWCIYKIKYRKGNDII